MIKTFKRQRLHHVISIEKSFYFFLNSISFRQFYKCVHKRNRQSQNRLLSMLMAENCFQLHVLTPAKGRNTPQRFLIAGTIARIF